MQSFAGATTELARILGVRFVPGSPANDTAVGRSTARVLQLINAGRPEDAWYELLRIAMLVKHLKEIEDARPDLIPRFTTRLLASDVSAYFGAREEIATASSLIRQGREFEYEPPGGPDFRVTVAGGSIGIECTSAHVAASLATPNIYVRGDPEPGAKNVSYKLASAIRAKAKRPYAAPNVALVIDATNVFALSASPRPNMDSADTALADGSYGAAIFHGFVFNLDDEVAELNYIRRDSPKIAPSLVAFLDDHFPRGSHRIERLVSPLLP
jgi:hypothetical protein